MNDEPIKIVDEVVIAGDPPKRHRSRAGLQRLQSGELFVAFRVGWDMFDISHGGLVGTWSTDGGHTWDESLPLAAEPSWDWFGAQRLLRLADDTLLMLLGKARWKTDVFLTFSSRSTDGGRTWEEIGPQINVLKVGSEPFGQGITQGLSGNRLMLGFQGADEKGAPSKVVAAISSNAGTTWTDLAVIAAEPGLHFREADLLRLNDGRILSVTRTDEPPYDSYQSYSADEGKTWTPVRKTGFQGHCPRLFQLRGGIMCVYRDMHPGRPGIACSVTYDEGQSWHYGSALYKSSGAYSGWGSACGYPAVVRLDDEQIFCVFHTDFVDQNSEIRGLWLRDTT